MTSVKGHSISVQLRNLPFKLLHDCTPFDLCLIEYIIHYGNEVSLLVNPDIFSPDDIKIVLNVQTTFIKLLLDLFFEVPQKCCNRSDK